MQSVRKAAAIHYG